MEVAEEEDWSKPKPSRGLLRFNRLSNIAELSRLGWERAGLRKLLPGPNKGGAGLFCGVAGVYGGRVGLEKGRTGKLRRGFFFFFDFSTSPTGRKVRLPSGFIFSFPFLAGLELTEKNGGIKEEIDLGSADGSERTESSETEEESEWSDFND